MTTKLKLPQIQFEQWNIKENQGIIILIFFCKACMEFAYYFAISPLYSYAKMIWKPNGISFILSIFFVTLIAISLPQRKEKISFYWCVLYDCFSIIPVISMFWMTSERSDTAFLVTAFDCIIHLILRIEKKQRFRIHLGGKRGNAYFLQIMFYVYVLSTLYLVTKRGVDLRVLSFLRDKAIYEVREETSFTRITAYLFNWNEKLFFPLFFAISLHKGKIIDACITVGCQFLLFMSYGFKLSIFSIMFVAGFYVVLCNKEKIACIILKLFSAVMVLMVILSYSGGRFFCKAGELITAFLGMMTLYFPAFIKFRFFEFFENHELLYFSEGMIGKIFGMQSPYGKPISLVMSEWVNGSGGSWNTGIVSDAYANLGVIGIVVVAVITGISLHILDSVTFHIPQYVKVTAICMYPIYMNDNGILTTFLTNGLVFMIFFLGLYDLTLTEERKNVAG